MAERVFEQDPDTIPSALLALKLTDNPGEGALKTLAEAEPPWVDSAIAALNPMHPLDTEGLIGALESAGIEIGTDMQRYEGSQALLARSA